MSQHYSDPTRESDRYALPDVETFEVSRNVLHSRAIDGDHGQLEPGWYYWFCFPGCLPESDPIGPFASEEEALTDARESAGYDDSEDCNCGLPNPHPGRPFDCPMHGPRE